MFERFNEPARAVVVGAREAAVQLRDERVGTEHLLLALLGEGALPAAVLAAAGLDRTLVRREVQRLRRSTPPLTAEDGAALRSIGIDPAEVLGRVERSFGAGALDAAWPAAARPRWRISRREPGFGRDAKQVLVLALREAMALHHRSLGSEHLLLGLLRMDEGAAARLLADAAVPVAAVRAQLLAALSDAA